eukprot:scaffold1193_cov158-Amphora_coffeaeformis.AAC.5
MSFNDKKRSVDEMSENRRLADQVKRLKEEVIHLKDKLAKYEDDSSDDDDGSDDHDDDESVCDGSAWSKNYFLLKQYKQVHGDCNVPRSHPKLGIWLKNVKASFAKKKIPQDRVDKLNKLGVVWGKGHTAPPSWEQRFAELKKHHEKFGNCNIHVDDKPELMTDMAKWVVEQRKQGKRLRKMKPSAMTMAQYDQLEALSFKWKVSTRKKLLK